MDPKPGNMTTRNKSDHPCPEAVTDLCRYHYSTPPPVSRWIDGAKTDQKVASSDHVRVTNVAVRARDLWTRSRET
ncbi:hypothetical protein TNCV_1715641 [Trichonephila clavipes]|nr:hypothetical protein TNCV_1715641 [Trichonephila clavipes]